VAAAEFFQVGGGPALGGGVDVDEVAGGAAFSDGADLGADDVLLG
jgi:hypothetical protein